MHQKNQRQVEGGLLKQMNQEVFRISSGNYPKLRISGQGQLPLSIPLATVNP